jgi:alkanesulfonate monooxygenase SsuD/methylene tetrahydromethanopterin reductase-like flavin-dependent oxidoreductase (luciferase family)
MVFAGTGLLLLLLAALCASCARARAPSALARVRAAAAKHGRPTPRFSLSVRPILADTEEKAWKKAEHILERATALQDQTGYRRPNHATDGAKRLLALATQRASDAPKALQEAEAAAAADKDGNALVRIGLGYSGLGQHDKAATLIQQGIAKGGLKRPEDAKLYLGIAQFRAGQKQRAAQTFRTVGGTDGTADLGRLWARVP